MEVNRLEVYKKMFAPPAGWDKTKAKEYQVKLIHKGQLESKNVPESFPFLAFSDKYDAVANGGYTEPDDVLLKRGNQIASLLNRTDPFSFDALENVVKQMSVDIPKTPNERLKQKVYVPGPREKIDTAKVTDHVGIHMTISTDYDQFKQLMKKGPMNQSVQAMFVSPNGDVTTPPSIRNLYIMIKFAGIKLLRRIDLQIYDAKQTLKDKARRDLKLYLEGKPSSVGRGRFNNAFEKAKTLGRVEDTYTYKGPSSVFGFRPIVTETVTKSESEWLLLGIVHDDEVLEELSPALKQNFGYNMWKLWVQRKTQATLKYLNRADTDRSSIKTKGTREPAYISDMPTYYGPGNTPPPIPRYATLPKLPVGVPPPPPAFALQPPASQQPPTSPVVDTCKKEYLERIDELIRGVRRHSPYDLVQYFPVPRPRKLAGNGWALEFSVDGVLAHFSDWLDESSCSKENLNLEGIVVEALEVLSRQADDWDNNLAYSFRNNESPWRNYTIQDLAKSFVQKLELTDDDLEKLKDNGISTLEELKNLTTTTVSRDDLIYKDYVKSDTIDNLLEQALPDWYKEEIKYSRGKCVTDGQQVGIIVSNTGNAVTVNFFPKEVTLFRTNVDPATAGQCEIAKKQLAEQIAAKKKVEQELISKQQEKEAEKIRKEREEKEEQLRALEVEAAAAKAKVTLTLKDGFLYNSKDEKIFQVVDPEPAQTFMKDEGFKNKKHLAKYLKTSLGGTAFFGIGHGPYEHIESNDKELYLRECGKPITELTEDIIEQAKEVLGELHKAGLHHTKIDPSKLIMHGGKLKLVVDEYHTIEGSKEIIGGIKLQTSSAFEGALTRENLLFDPHEYDDIQITPLLIGQDKSESANTNLPWLFVGGIHSKQEQFIKTIDKWMLAVSLLLISRNNTYLKFMFGNDQKPNLFYRRDVSGYQIFREDVKGDSDGSKQQIVNGIIENKNLQLTKFGINGSMESVLKIMEEWIRKHNSLDNQVLTGLYGIEGKLVKKIFEPLCKVIGGCNQPTRASTRRTKPGGDEYDSYSDEELHELADLSDYELEDMITDVLGYDSSSDSGAPLSYDSSSDNAQLSYNSESAYGSESAGYNSESDAD